MNSERDNRFRELLTELNDAYREYIDELQPATTPLGDLPPQPRQVDWENWRRVKERFDKADAAMLDFLRGGG